MCVGRKPPSNVACEVLFVGMRPHAEGGVERDAADLGVVCYCAPSPSRCRPLTSWLMSPWNRRRRGGPCWRKKRLPLFCHFRQLTAE